MASVTPRNPVLIAFRVYVAGTPEVAVDYSEMTAEDADDWLSNQLDQTRRDIEHARRVLHRIAALNG